MSDALKAEIQLNGRNLKIWGLPDGGYRYATTTGADQDPTHTIEAGSTTFIPPVDKGSPIEDSVDDLSTLQADLVEVAGFSNDEARKACAQVITADFGVGKKVKHFLFGIGEIAEMTETTNGLDEIGYRAVIKFESGDIKDIQLPMAHGKLLPTGA